MSTEAGRPSPQRRRTWSRPLILAVVALSLLTSVSAAVALWPEPPVRQLAGLRIIGAKDLAAQPRLSDVTGRDVSVHAAVKAWADQRLIRTWSPAGISPMDLSIGPIPHVGFLGVPYQGTVRDDRGLNSLFLSCSKDDSRRPVSTGGTHTALLEDVVPLRDWCPDGEIWLRLNAGSSTTNVGVGLPYEVSAIAYWKRTFLGYVIYFIVAQVVALAVFFAGGLAARIARTGLDPVLAGLLAVGGGSLIAFYAYGWSPIPAPLGLVGVVAVVATAMVAVLRAPALARSVWRAQRGPATAWILVAAFAFISLYLGSTGSGTWEVNYRYAPATWSSDHTLPLYLAEAARVGSVQTEGRIDPWSLGDRPPLLAGAYLLVADAFALLQGANGGPYLQPIVLGISGIVFCALWAPSFYWAARRAARLPRPIVSIGVLLVALTPFALFNTAYTWPKLMATGFSLAAAAYAFRPRAGRPRLGETMTYGALAGLALMCHAASAFFIAPVSAFYVLRRLWRAPLEGAAGANVGLSILGLWSLYKAAVLPSSDPLLKFALTGDPGFGRPDASLAKLLHDRYAGLGFGDWFRTKLEVASYLITPAPPAGPVSLARPPGLQALHTDVLGYLRFWDFYALSLGNAALLVLAGVAVVGAVRSPNGAPWATIVRPLVASTLACFALFVLATFLPLIVHQFSYDAILAGALAGTVVLAQSRPGVIALAALTTFTTIYTTVVWIVAPLGATVSLDWVAIAAFGVLIGAAAAHIFTDRAAMSVIGLRWPATIPEAAGSRIP